jgi:hypothetical protein
LAASFLFRKYAGGTIAGVIIRIAWLLTMMIFFFIFSMHQFNLAQNLTVGVVGVAALVYFLFRLKSIHRNSDRYKSNNHHRNSEI